MRGKVLPPPIPRRRLGITPAYAGKSQVKVSNDGYVTGSPPPMRGKAWAEAKAPADERITPAYAGKSLNDDLTVQLYRGSPPPMRGKAACSRLYRR